MRRTWTIIGVADVAASFGWYRSLFGLPPGAPAHDFFGQILDDDGTVLLCVHAWGAHEHPSLTSPQRAEPGNGLLLFFRIDDFDATLHRARALVPRLEEEPHLNPSTGTLEFALRDPDGYCVMVSALSAARGNRVVSDQDEIRDVVARWHSASRAGDVETVLGLMTDDVVFLLPGRPPMRKTEFAELSRATPVASAPSTESTQQIGEILVSGDLAYMWSRLEVVVTPPDAMQPIARAGHTLTVFRRENGRWLLARDANLLTVVQRPDA